MAAPGTIRSGVGFRNVVIFALDSDGYPAATDHNIYEGVIITGAKGLTIEDPEPRDIVHLGDDAVFQRDILPPDSPLGGELVVAKTSDAVDAVLSDDVAFQVGEANMFGIGSDNKGDENQVALLAYRQTLDTNPGSSDFGKRRWEARLFPKAYLIRRETGFNDTPEERAYSMRPLFVANHIWGTSFASGTEGFDRAQGIRIVSEFKPKIVAWLSEDSTTVSYPFSTTYPAQAAAKVAVWVDGVLQTADFTAYTTGILFSAAPTSGGTVVAFYEYA